MRIEIAHTSGVSADILAKLKDHLRLTTDDFDNNLSLYLAAAITTAEKYTGQIFRRSECRISGVFEHIVRTGILPIISVEKVLVDDVELDRNIVEVEESVIRFPENVSGKRMEIALDAGFAEMPADVFAAVLLMASKLFENPADSVEQLPKASTNLLRPYKRWGR